jgi:hypothetical protein
MSRQDGGPAYPSIYEQQGGNDSGSAVFFSNPGMSLRDYFAGQALAGYSSLDFVYQNIGHPAVAQMAYDAADAMLSERAKQ